MQQLARCDPSHPTGPRRSVAVSSFTRGAGHDVGLGSYGYSYLFVRRAFEPLLANWGDVTLVQRPESRLDYVVRQALRRGQAPLALSFWPIQDVYLTRAAPNVLFPFWEFPDIPVDDLGDNPRTNWVRIANHASLIVCASHFTAAALQRAGVRTPIRVVPVPVEPAYFELPVWQPGQTVSLDCKAYVFTRPHAQPKSIADPEAWVRGFRRRAKRKLTHWAQRIWGKGIKPRLSPRLSDALVAGTRAWRDGGIELATPLKQFTLSGVVYTTILNPDDPRKNWRDLLTAYLAALGDRDEATLVVKLVTSTDAAVREVVGYYRRIGVPHRCRLVLITGFLDETALGRLAEASTYYVNGSRAEGACLPLQDFLAAGRPALAPTHTALADYFDEQVGFVVDSHPEPCAWPWDESGRLSTSWHRIVWASLRDQFAASFATAREQPAAYRQLSAAARSRIAAWASRESVGQQLAGALESVEPAAWQIQGPHGPRVMRAAGHKGNGG